MILWCVCLKSVLFRVFVCDVTTALQLHSQLPVLFVFCTLVLLTQHFATGVMERLSWTPAKFSPSTEGGTLGICICGLVRIHSPTWPKTTRNRSFTRVITATALLTTRRHRTRVTSQRRRRRVKCDKEAEKEMTDERKWKRRCVRKRKRGRRREERRTGR